MNEKSSISSHFVHVGFKTVGGQYRRFKGILENQLSNTNEINTAVEMNMLVLKFIYRVKIHVGKKNKKINVFANTQTF